MYPQWFSKKQKQPPEEFYKKGVLKILQYSQENTCVGVSFLIKLQAFRSENIFLWILRKF